MKKKGGFLWMILSFVTGVFSGDAFSQDSDAFSQAVRSDAVRSVTDRSDIVRSDVLQVTEHTLSNGLTVWLNEDRTRPRILGAVVVNAGARDCPDTGIAHYFEHIMFKGTDKIGTLNFAAEKVILDSIAAKYDELAVTKEEEQRRRIQQEINQMSVRAADYAIPNEFSRLISEYGGSGLNAFTGQDITVYLNTFTPQYIEHWAELNSERLVSPVFRLFQSELETVYEEKNMYDNNFGYNTFEKLSERVFQPSEYAFPIIGSAKNLKNPQLSEMKAFYEKYYVASNMGLMLSGDFDTETILPVLERTFSRIPRGEKPERLFTEPTYFNGKETFTARLKIPVVKVGGLVYKGITEFDADYNTLNLFIGMLSNAHTGYLNQLNVDRKLLLSDIANFKQNKAALSVLFFMPKLLFQSYGKAQSLVLHEIDRIKTGDFTDEMLDGAKLNLRQELLTSLEDTQERALCMLSCFSNGQQWEDYLSSIDAIDTLTREDVIRVANHYFGTDYLEVRKKYGSYPNDPISKPDYKPVVPPYKDSSSVYAETLQTLPTGKQAIRVIDFEEDAQTIRLQSLASLYVTKNPMNDIFTLKLVYGIGQTEEPKLSKLSNYLGLIGTDSLSFEALGTAMYQLGADISFEVNDDDFVISIRGFDHHLDKTVSLVGQFLNRYRVDKKKIKSSNDFDRVERTSTRSTPDMAYALFEKIRYGDASRFLKKIEKIKSSDVTRLFEKVLATECNIHYCGVHSARHVAQCINAHLPLDKIKNPSNSPIQKEPMVYEQPLIFLLDMPKSTQSIIYSYLPIDTLHSLEQRYDGLLYSQYLGGGMFSLMFQEIREFRSLAYSAQAQINRPSWKKKDKRSYLYTHMSTQCDKTLDALAVLDSLQKNMPFSSRKVETVKKELYNEVAAGYPDFRHVSENIATHRRNGYDKDPTENVMRYLEKADLQHVAGFYEHYLKGRPIVYCIVGDLKQIDRKQLERFGQVITVKKKDIYKR